MDPLDAEIDKALEDEVSAALGSPAPPTGVPMRSAAAPNWGPPQGPGVPYPAPEGPAFDPGPTLPPGQNPQQTAMAENRRSGWDPAKIFLNVAAFGQRPRLKAALAAVTPAGLRSPEQAAALGTAGTYDEARRFYEQDQDQALEGTPAVPRLALALAGGAASGPALVRALGTPITTATGATGLARAGTGVLDAALMSAGLGAAAAPEGRVAERSWEAAKSPWNLVGAIPGLAEFGSKTVGPLLRARAADRAYRSVGETTDLNNAARRFDPSGEGAVDPGRRAMGETLRDAPILRRGMSPSDVDMAVKRYRDQVGADKGRLVDEATAAGAHPDWEGLKADLTDLAKQLRSPEVVTAHGAGPYNDLMEMITRLEKQYAPIPKQPIATVAGSGAQVAGKPIGPGAAQNANEVGLIPPTRTDYQPIRDIPEPPATPSMMAEVEEGLAGSRAPQTEAYLERTGLPGTEFPAPKLDWIEGQNRRTFREWEALKTEIQNFIELKRQGFVAPNTVESANPLLRTLRATSGKLTAADDAALAAALGPEKAAEYAAVKRLYGITSEAGKAAQKSAEAARGDRSALRESAYLGRHLPAAVVGGAAGYGHGLPGMLAGAGSALALEKAARWAGQAHPTFTRVYDAAGKAAQATPQMDPQVAQLINYLRATQEENAP